MTGNCTPTLIDRTAPSTFTDLAFRYVCRHHLSVDAIRCYLKAEGDDLTLLCIWLELGDQTRRIICRLYVLTLLTTEEGRTRFAADNGMTEEEAFRMAFIRNDKEASA